MCVGGGRGGAGRESIKLGISCSCRVAAGGVCLQGGALPSTLLLQPGVEEEYKNPRSRGQTSVSPEWEQRDTTLTTGWRQCPLEVRLTFTSSLWSHTSSAWSGGVEKKVEAAAVSHSLMELTPPPPFLQEQFEFALTAVAEEVNAILKALPQ